MTRLVILCVLLASGAASGFAIWTIERASHQRDQQQEAKAATIERLLSSIATISSVQQAFADYARRDMASFTQVALQVDRLTTEAAGLRAAAQSGASSERLEEFWTALSALMGAESRARELFAGGDENGAADALLASAREHVTSLDATLRAFRQAESVEHRRADVTSSRLFWTVMGTTAALWAIGLVGFAVRPLREVEPEAAAKAETAPSSDRPLIAPAADGAPAIDLADAAALARELSLLSDRAALEAFLGRAADLLEARGIIIWMRAGDELVAAAAHGYQPSVLRRIPSIARHADNATAAAWRCGETGTVPEDASGYGAIVAPMMNPAGCVGVFAAEVRGGREGDSATCAATTILAAQLAGVLAAWPAPSTTDLDARPSDRQAAAS
jgi:hypothetical protein